MELRPIKQSRITWIVFALTIAVFGSCANVTKLVDGIQTEMLESKIDSKGIYLEYDVSYDLKAVVGEEKYETLRITLCEDTLSSMAAFSNQHISGVLIFSSRSVQMIPLREEVEVTITCLPTMGSQRLFQLNYFSRVANGLQEFYFQLRN